MGKVESMRPRNKSTVSISWKQRLIFQLIGKKRSICYVVAWASDLIRFVSSRGRVSLCRNNLRGSRGEKRIVNSGTRVEGGPKRRVSYSKSCISAPFWNELRKQTVSPRSFLALESLYLMNIFDMLPWDLTGKRWKGVFCLHIRLAASIQDGGDPFEVLNYKACPASAQIKIGSDLLRLSFSRLAK